MNVRHTLSAALLAAATLEGFGGFIPAHASPEPGVWRAAAGGGLQPVRGDDWAGRDRGRWERGDWDRYQRDWDERDRGRDHRHGRHDNDRTPDYAECRSSLLLTFPSLKRTDRC